MSGACGSRSHRIHSQEAEKDRELNKAACFLLFNPSQSTVTFREEGLPTSTVLIQKLLTDMPRGLSPRSISPSS